MKKFVLSCIFAILCITTAAAIAYYIGNRPVRSYYPNKQIRASIPRRFFIPHGIAKVYHPNGQLSYQYQVVNNINNGELSFFLPGQTLTFHYVNDKILGPVQIKNKANETQDVKIVFEPANKLEISLIRENATTHLFGRRLCTDDDFLLKLEHYAETMTPDALTNVLACFTIDNATYKDVNTDCQIKGEYIYPNFKTDFQAVCSVLNSSEGLTKDFKNLKIESLYAVKDDTAKIKAFDKNKPQSILTLSYKGINKTFQGFLDSFILTNKDNQTEKFIAILLNNLTSSNARLIANGKKIWDINGDFNVINGFSTPYFISSYTDNEMSSQFKISDEGVTFKALYPISKTPMLSFGFNINDIFKLKYKNLMQNISKLLIEQVQTKDISSDLMDYAWEFSDLFKSAYAKLMDIQGQPVIGIQIHLKKGLSSKQISQAPGAAFQLMLHTYQNGAVAHQATGNFQEGFILDGKPVQFDEILALFNTPSINAVLEDINNELELKYGSVIEKAQTPEDYIGIDPFFLAFYSTYKDSVLKYKLNQTMMQITTIVYGLQSLYADDGNYNHLSANDMKKSGIITEDMLTSNNTLLNAFGGKIRILKSKAQFDSEDHDAFILIYEGLPSDACFDLATIDWGGLNPGFIAIKASSRGTADVTKAYRNRSFEKRPNGTVYKPFDAQRACSNGMSTSVALKFE